MKKFIMVLVLLGTSAYAKCSDADLGYSEGYPSAKDAFKPGSASVAIVKAYADGYCKTSTYSYFGERKITNQKAFFDGCMKGSLDAFNGKKQGVTCK